MSLHLKLLDIDHPLSFEESKLRQIEAHALIYLSTTTILLVFFFNFQVVPQSKIAYHPVVDLSDRKGNSHQAIR